MNRAFISVIIALAIMAFGHAKIAAGETGRDEVIERVIKIEGSLEKPKVMFIVPKANLWRKKAMDKSFREEFLKPVYPGKEDDKNQE